MTISPTEFWKRIAEYHLATSQDCRMWAAEIAEVAGPQAIGDVDKIVECLMRTGKLTAFQANALTLDIPERLSIGPYIIQEPIDQHPFQSWKVANNSLAKQTAWLFIVDESVLSDPLWSSHPPSIALCRKHARLHATGLQSIAEPVAFGNTIVLATPVLTGASLAESMHSDSMPWAQSIAIIQSVSRALQSMHAATLTHGSLHLDRVWQTDQGEILLLRDPLFPPQSPLIETRIGCLDSGENTSCYAAPEFLVPGQNPTVQTDLYAFGCLWYELLTGNAPFADLPASGRTEAHTSRPVLLPMNIQFPKPLQQCLMHLLAKNPRARFATVKLFDAALMQALLDVNFDPSQSPMAPPVVARESNSTKKNVEGPPSNSPRVSVPPPVPASANSAPAASKPKPDAVSDASAIEPREPKRAVEPIKAIVPTRVAEPTKAIVPTNIAEPKRVIDNAWNAATPDRVEPSPVPPKASSVATPVPAMTNQPSPSSPSKSSQPDSNALSPAKPSVPPKIERKEDAKPQPVKQSTPPPETTAPASPPQTKTEPTPTASVPTAATKKDSVPASTKPIAPPSTKPDSIKPETSRATPQKEQTGSTDAKTVNPPAPPVATFQPSPAQTEQSITPSTATVPPQASKPVVSEATQRSFSVAASNSPKSTLGKKSTRGKRKAKRPVWFIPALFGGATVVLIGLIVAFLQKPKQPTTTETKSREVVTSTTGESTNSINASEVPATTSNPLDEQFIAQDDDGSLPWIPPHASQPFSVDMIPPGAHGFIFIRPEAWLESPEGLGIVDLLETEVGPLWKELQSIAGVPPSQIRSIAISIFTGESGWPHYAYRIDLKEKITISELRELWKNPTEESLDSKNSILVSGERAYYIPKQPIVNATSIETFAVGPKTTIRELAELKGAIAPQRKQIEELLRSTDSKSDLTIVIAPNFLFTDATQVLATYAPTIVSDLETLVGTKMRAGLFTTTLAPQWYVEFRLLGESEQNAGQLVGDLKKRFSEMADKVEAAFVQSPPHPHWRAIAARFPQMLRSLQKHQRFGVENGQTISNFYLPSSAAPNLVLASWMAVQQPMAAPIKPATVTNTSKPLTPEQMLDRPITIAFDQESLEVALQSISEEANRDLPGGTKPLVMEIVSAALERDGITRNQQIKEFKHKQQPLRAVLLDLVLRANPIRTVKLPTEADQKLVWILADDLKNAGNKLLQITTRRATTEANITLPTEFIPK